MFVTSTDSTSSAVDGVDDGPQHGIGREHENRGQRGFEDQVGPGRRAHGRRAPPRSGRVEAAQVAFLTHDDPGTQETDAGHHVGDDMHRPFMAVEPVGHVNEHGGTDRHRHIGMQACRALPVLPFETDQPSQHKGRGQVSRVSSNEARLMFCNAITVPPSLPALPAAIDTLRCLGHAHVGQHDQRQHCDVQRRRLAA